MKTNARLKIKEHVCNDCEGDGEIRTGDEWTGLVLQTCTTCLGEGMTKSLGNHVPFSLIDPMEFDKLAMIHDEIAQY